jgi:hypothetical protein
MNTPKFNIKDVIDLRFSKDNMPDRIYIHAIFIKESDTEWMYKVLSEKSNGYITLPESYINKFFSKKERPCYDNEVVKELYDNGFRFCGNYKKDTAINKANSIKSANYIKHIILAEAIDKNGNPMVGYLGLWVQYNTIISNEYASNKHFIIK